MYLLMWSLGFIVGFKSGLLEFKGFHFTNLIWQNFWETPSEYVKNVDTVIKKE